MKDKVVELESLRGLAALSVVFAHIPPWNADFYAIPFVRNAGGMVEFFFVLSGFVIALTYGERITKFSDAARFQFLRFGRLYPVHLVFLLSVAGFEAIKLFFIRDPLSPAFAPGFTGPREFVENLLLVQGLGFSAQPSSFNGPSWTISTEFYVYALFACVVLIAPARKNVVFAVLMVAAAALLIIDWPPAFSFSRLILCICGFFCGCLVAEVSQYLKTKTVTLPALLTPLSVLALVIYLSVTVRESLWELALIFVFAAIIVLSVANGRDGSFKAVLRSAPLAWLGMISYSLYMAHYPVIYALHVVMRRFLDMPKAIIDGQPVVQLSGVNFGIACFIVLAVVFVVSAASYYLVESPARMWSRRLAAVER